MGGALVPVSVAVCLSEPHVSLSVSVSGGRVGSVSRNMPRSVPVIEAVPVLGRLPVSVILPGPVRQNCNLSFKLMDWRRKELYS